MQATAAWGLALAALVVLPALPLLTGQGLLVQHDIWISDLLHSQLPYKAFLGRQLAAGHLPLWMPDIFSGVPFLAQVEAGALYLPHWPLFALLDPYRALGLALLLDLVVAATGSFALTRRMGAHPAGALLAGLSFAWCGFMLTHGRHLNMHAAASLLPWILLVQQILLDSGGRRGGPTLAVLLALQLAAGHPQITWMTGLLLAARWFVATPGQPKDRLLRSGFALAGATVLGGLLLAVQLLPAAAFTRSSLATTPPTWEYASAFPFALHDLWAFVWPPLAGAMESYDHPGGDTIPWGNYGYAGILPLFLAPVGLLRGAPTRRTRWFWGLTVVVSLLLVTGPHTPLWRAVWTVVPGARIFRFPTRFLLFVDLGLALLGGLGLSAVLRRLQPRTAGLVGAALCVLTLAELHVHQGLRFPIDDVQPWRQATAVADALGGSGLHGSGPDERVWTLGEIQPWEAAFHEARGFTEGTTPYRRAWQLPIGSSGLLTGLRSASGYARMVHVRTAAFWQPYNRGLLPLAISARTPTPDDPAMPAALSALLDRGAVTALVATWAPEGAGQPLLDDPAHVFRRGTALPRAYLAPTWQPVDDLRAAGRWMLKDGLDHLETPALEGADEPPPRAGLESGGGIVPLTLQEQGTDALKVSTPTGSPAGVLVVADSWDEGWRAWVDGVEQPVLVANGYQRGVLVGAGAHTLVMRYRPPGLSAGVTVSVGAGALLLAWALLAVRARSRDSRGERTTNSGRALISS